MEARAVCTEILFISFHLLKGRLTFRNRRSLSSQLFFSHYLHSLWSLFLIDHMHYLVTKQNVFLNLRRISFSDTEKGKDIPNPVIKELRIIKRHREMRGNIQYDTEFVRRFYKKKWCRNLLLRGNLSYHIISYHTSHHIIPQNIKRSP
jgi:hypothetical protein